MIYYETIGLTKLGMTIEIQCFKRLNIVYRANYGILCLSGYGPHCASRGLVTNKLRVTVFSQN